MPDPDISPVPDSVKPEGAAHYRAEDIELPPLPTADSAEAQASSRSPRPSSAGGSKGIAKTLGAAVLIGAVLAGGWLVGHRGSSLEKQHENWQHVAAAAKVSSDTEQQLIYVDGSGTSKTLTSIEVAAADADRRTTREVRAALRRNDLVTATAMLQAGQQMPTASENGEVRPPVLSPDSELTTALKEGRKELYQIELFDCCHEDGDIVEVLVNNVSFATVPIMHNGSMLSIPLDRGNNTVTVRGIKDGGGGVTVSFRTSRGDSFARYMQVGEEHTLGVVVQ